MARGGKRPGAGRKKGSKEKKTIEREVALAQYQQLILQRLVPIFKHQFSLVKGTAFLYRIEEHKNGAKEHVLVDDPYEIGDVLSQRDGWKGRAVNDQYYYHCQNRTSRMSIR